MKKKVAAVLAAMSVVMGAGIVGPMTAAQASVETAAQSAMAATAAKKKATYSVSLKTSAKKPLIGDTVTLTARVEKNTKALKGVSVVIDRLHALSGRWQRIGMAKTNSEGIATYKRKVDKGDGEYRIRYQGTSAQADIQTRPKVIWDMPAKKTVAPGQMWDFRATVKDFAGHTVTLQYWDPKSGKWQNYNGLLYPTASSKAPDIYSQTSDSRLWLDTQGTAVGRFWPFSTQGSHKVRLRFDASQVHGYSYSNTMTIVVK